MAAAMDSATYPEIDEQVNDADIMSENTNDLHIVADDAETESQKLLKGVSTENISDDQELFLKVLENLKNAVNAKPEYHAIPLSKNLSKTPHSLAEDLNVSKPDYYGLSQSESLSTFIASDQSDKRATTMVTVSDKTKSLILQKLAVASDTETVSKSHYAAHFVIDNDGASNSSDKGHSSKEVTRNASQYSPVDMFKKDNSEGVKLTVMGFDNLTQKITEKDVLSARVINKENVDRTFEKVVHVMPTSNQKQLGRLIAPATPAVKLFTCTFCDYYSENKNYLKQHIDYVHKSERPYKCSYCDYAGKRVHALREHLIVHSDERPYQCKSCNATFRKKGHLTNHIKLHNSKRLVKCPLCKVLVYDTGENGLDAHLKNDHDTERLYGCDLCDHVAANEPDILKHLNEKHKSKISSHTCGKCPFQTANIADFNAHVAAHNISDGKVQIGNAAMTKVIGVASLPSGSHDFGITNTSVKLNTNESQKQPAVIKPVWIKCSECGFTGQDSEVIKKHMLEHLNIKDYNIDDVYHRPYVQKSASPVKTSATLPSVTRTLTNSESSKLSTQQSNMETPILVPVTNVDQLFPHHAGKIDMRSPILVPVTNPSMLKNLQSVPKYSPAKVPVKCVRNGVEIQPLSQQSVPQPMGVFPHTFQDVTQPTTVFSNAFPTGTTTHEANTASLTNKTNNSKVAPKQQVITLQREQMQQLLRNPNLKVVPVTANQPIGVADQTMATCQNNQSTPRGFVSVSNPTKEMPGPISTNKQMFAVSSLPVNTPVQTTPSFTLTQIPVPRMLSTMAAPKLPPEIIQMSHSPVSEGNNSPVSGGELELNQPATQHEPEPTEEQKLAVLRQSLANVKHLIAQQEKLNRQIGNTSLLKLDAKGIPEKINSQKVIYYMTPVSKQNTTKNTENAGFTHDSNAGRFRCTLCGYTCEYQRTIKAHIWKHSGNKDVDYPMFQNGPLSIYEDGHSQLSPKVGHDENLVEPQKEQTNASVPLSLPPGFQLVSSENNLENEIESIQQSSGKMPSFIVYEQTKISNVAPALAQLIAARTMVGLKEVDNVDNNTVSISNVAKNDKEILKVNEPVMVTTEQTCSIQEQQGHRSKIGTKALEPEKVVVESVNSVANSSEFTSMQSQQNSPRIGAPKSPDSGVSEMTSTTKTTEDRSISSGFISPLPNFEYISDESELPGRLRRSKRKINSLEVDKMSDSSLAADGASSAKQGKVSQTREDSAVTLLSLLKKGPNYNPACPPKAGQVIITSTDVSGAPSPPEHEDSNSIGDSDMSSLKPKSGISTSLLAVIEQLRERSKSDLEEEKQTTALQTKKQSKRRGSRKSSVEDNTPATGIDNVEEFISEGEVKFRCKLCHYTNDSTVLLRQHMRLHKPKQEFECSLCDLIAESSESLQDHMIQHCKIRTYQCKQCASAFNYKSQLRAHMRMHNDQDILMCDFCDFETRSASALKAHTKSHLTKPPYKCETCKEEFITSFNFRTHRRDGCYTSADTWNFKCDECEFTSVGRREMKNHQKGHMGRSTIQAPKKCPYCEHTETTIDLIQMHISEAHGGSQPLKCEMCGFVAVSIRSLKSHMKRHVNDQRFVAQPLEQYKCNLCGYVCHHLPSLKSHMWRHAADQHYSYEFTNDVINAAIDFDSHTEAVDTKQEHVENFKKLIYDKMKSKGLENTRGTQEESAMACCWVTFRCCQCGFETINKAELNMHMTAHSDVIKWTLDVQDEADKGVNHSAQKLQV